MVALHRSSALLEALSLEAHSVACDDQEQIRPPPEASTGETTACDLSETSFEAQPLARPLPGHICSKRSSGYSQLPSFVRQEKAKARSRLAVLFRVLVARSCAMQPQTRRSPAPPSSSSSPPASLRPARPLLAIARLSPLGKEPALQKHPRSRLRGYQDRLASGVFVGTVNASSDWIIGRALLLALARF